MSLDGQGDQCESARDREKRKGGGLKETRVKSEEVNERRALAFIISVRSKPSLLPSR